MITRFSDRIQLFMEYPHLVRGSEARFLAHVTVLETGDPVRSGSLTLEVVGPDGTIIAAVAEQPARDGLFIPVATFEAEGPFTGRVRVTSPQVDDQVEFGAVIIHPDEDAALRAAAETAAVESPEAIPFLLEQQWKIDFRLERASRRTLAQRLLVPGTVEAAVGRSAAVSPPIAGRLLPPWPRSLPRPGDRVEAGQLLARIEPPLTVMVEIEQTIGRAATDLRFARRSFERISDLRGKGLGTDVQIQEAERELRLAELEHLRALRLSASFHDTGPRSSDGDVAPPVPTLAESLATEGDDAGPHNDGEPPAPPPLALRVVAPIRGTIVAVNHVEGEHVDVADVLYRIADTEVVWVTGRVSEFDLAELPDTPSACLSLPSRPGALLDVAALGGSLVTIGTVVDPATRTLPITYELPNPGTLRIGMLVDMFLQTRQARDALAVPESAIVPDAGRSTIYVLVDGEHFQWREVVLGIRDSGWVEVKEGLADGEWVVASGGNAVRLAALSPASFGHGHAH